MIQGETATKAVDDLGRLLLSAVPLPSELLSPFDRRAVEVAADRVSLVTLCCDTPSAVSPVRCCFPWAHDVRVRASSHLLQKGATMALLPN